MYTAEEANVFEHFKKVIEAHNKSKLNKTQTHDEAKMWEAIVYCGLFMFLMTLFLSLIQ